ncbi:MAG TPA: hypothetical protein ENJ50_00990 [Planctomycetaceae bacterium]|nr:hypothetical protein [Planctomycetaceae bacterium]
MTVDHSDDRLKDFADLVQRMRQAQQQYFRYRTKAWLELSKRLEKEVDDAIRDIFQPQLFG